LLADYDGARCRSHLADELITPLFSPPVFRYYHLSIPRGILDGFLGYPEKYRMAFVGRPLGVNDAYYFNFLRRLKSFPLIWE